MKLIPLSLENHQTTLSLLLNTGHNAITTTTVTAPPGGTDTVIIREPPNYTVTTTEYWSQSFATTTTVTAPPGGTDTVIIYESMSSSKISTSSNDITSIIPSFSRPHYVNSTTSDLSTFESSSMNTPTSISSDGMLLSSTTLVTESETTTELICSDGKECSRLQFFWYCHKSR